MEKFVYTVCSLRQLRFALYLSFLLWFLACCYSAYSTLYKHNSFRLMEMKPIKKSCLGRYIYMYDTPTRFNTQILTHNCSDLLKWPPSDMCKSILNMGIGPQIETFHGHGHGQGHGDGDGGLLESNGWFVTNPYLLELIFHNRMKKYECLTNNSSLASAIYVPFYAAVDLGRYLWGFNSSVRDSGPNDLVKWLVQKQEWQSMWGRDHFFVVGRTAWDFRRLTNIDPNWGNILMDLPQVKNMTVLAIESSTSEFAIPYPTNFHPSNDYQVFAWQNKVRKQKRNYLFSFIGAPRPKQQDSIRSEIISQCLSAREKCKWSDCQTSSSENCDDPNYVIKTFRNSTFCLQPRGDTPTRRSTFDSILAGCIPVFFSIKTAYTQYKWYLPKNYSLYSVFIPESMIKHGIADIEKTLSEISEDKVVKMREEVIRLIPHVMYANPSSSSSRLETFEDAFDIAVKGVVERVEKIRKEMEKK